MSDPNGAPAAAWYLDPQIPGQVRWWDGMKWTEHVSAPAQPVRPVRPVQPVQPVQSEIMADVPSAGYGRHAAAHPPAQQATQVPQIDEQERVQLPATSLSYA